MLPKRLRQRVDAMPTVIAWATYAASFGTILTLVASIVSSVLGHTPLGLSTSFGHGVAAVWVTAAVFGIVTCLLFWRDARAWMLLVATFIGGALWQVTVTRLDLGVVAAIVILLLPETRRYFFVGRRVAH